MPRDIPVSNGSMLVTFDKNYQLRDFYYPYVGLENHTIGHPFRLGVWADGEFSEMGPEWQKDMRYLKDTLITEVKARNDKLGLELTCNDLVDFHLNIYLKKMTLKNLKNQPRDLRLFFSHDFHISGNEVGDTAYYDPRTQSLIHYKGKRYFLMNCCDDTKCGVEHFACGLKETQGLQGTWKDAVDGNLSGNSVAQGSVDSTVGINIPLAAQAITSVYYWICAGNTYQEVVKLNRSVREKTPDKLFTRSENYWKLWITQELCPGGETLSLKIFQLLKQSLLIMRTQIDNNGAILASNDTDIMDFSRDTYSYMWPRDGALVAASFIKAGYSEISRRFFNFCSQIVDPGGYFLHKFTPDGSVGSTWHPWWKNNEPELPIQEDETALVLWALWKHFDRFHDVEFIKPLYRDLIILSAEFMVNYRDEKTKLPKPSYDLWEEERGVHTFTVSTVFAGLKAAANFAEAFGEKNLSLKYRQATEEIKKSMKLYLFNPSLNRFAKTAQMDSNGKYTLEMKLDASLFALWFFEVFEPNDPMVRSTLQAVHSQLKVKTNVGGVARYENDAYHKTVFDYVERAKIFRRKFEQKSSR